MAQLSKAQKAPGRLGPFALCVEDLSKAVMALVDENKRFVEEFANPHSWLMMADDLHEQATTIYENRNRSSILTKVNASGEILQQTRLIDKSVFLLGGFALENAIKAFLVYENPSWISNGRLSTKLRSHSLSGLQKQSKLIPYKTRHIHVLEAFESGLDSWFRYPCAVAVQDTKQESPLFDHLWVSYGKVMCAYGKKLRTLLNKGWNGPHSTYGRWTFQGETLGYSPAQNSPMTLRLEDTKGKASR